MDVTAEQLGTAPRLAPRHGLQRGRTWFLAAADVAALATAWIATDLVSNRIGPLPAVFGPAWLLIGVAVLAVPLWLALFTAYDLYDNDALRISVSSFDEVRDVFHALLLGSLFFLIVSQGLRYLAGWWISSAVEAASSEKVRNVATPGMSAAASSRRSAVRSTTAAIVTSVRCAYAGQWPLRAKKRLSAASLRRNPENGHWAANMMPRKTNSPGVALA